MLGSFIGNALNRDSTTDGKTPAVVETVYVEKTVQVSTMPESCLVVLNQMMQIIDEAGVVAGHDGKQLDIMSLAYQAIYQKDWKTLNELSERQRQMWFGLTEETRAVLPEIPDIKGDVDKCKDEAGS